MDTNCCIFTGRLTQNAEQKTLPNGLVIVNFSLAFSEPKKSKTEAGKYEYYSNYVNCTIFGNYGKALFPALKKGQEATVTCRLHQNRWEDNGVKRSSYDFVVNNLILQRPPKKQAAQTGQDKAAESAVNQDEYIPQEISESGEPIY